jgi:hypothetical protein
MQLILDSKDITRHYVALTNSIDLNGWIIRYLYYFWKRNKRKRQFRLEIACLICHKLLTPYLCNGDPALGHLTRKLSTTRYNDRRCSINTVP